jgi:hypothetical protein
MDSMNIIFYIFIISNGLLYRVFPVICRILVFEWAWVPVHSGIPFELWHEDNIILLSLRSS